MKKVLLLTLLLCPFLIHAETVTEVYQPSYITSQELAASVTNLYGDDIAVSAEGSRLVIRGASEQIRELQELLQQLDQPPQQFIIAISAVPHKGSIKQYGTQRSPILQTFSVTEGHRLTLLKQRQQQRVTSAGWYAVEIEDKAVKQEALSLTIHAATDIVTVDISLQTLNNNQWQQINRQLSGSFNEWLPISASAHAANAQHFGTQRSDSNSLYIKISRP